jgi:hypothetical protein
MKTNTQLPTSLPVCPTDGLNIALQVLNEACAADGVALETLIRNRVPCNLALAGHPNIQVWMNHVTPTETFDVGMLGVINGILDRMTGNRVAAIFSGPEATGETKLLGFCQYTPKQQIL